MPRRSARLASAKAQAKASPSVNLQPVVEREESPVNETTQNSIIVAMSSPHRAPQTPSSKLPKPPMSEMHPSKAHPTMAAPSSALRLGFTDIKPTTSTHPAAGPQQSTPSKLKAPSSTSKVQLTRAQTNTTLGDDAQRIMDEIREEAVKIKVELAAKRERERLDEEQVNTRKFAQPKGKAGRFSDVHMAEFKKMDSIENHPSAFRAAPGRSTPAAARPKNLKRSQSKANLDDTEAPRVKTPAKANASQSSKKINTPANESDSPAKRAKQRVDDDASTNRPTPREGSSIPRPKTPGKHANGLPRSKSNLANLMSPTQASVTRATSTKTPTTIRSLLKSPSKIAFPGLKKSATVGALDRTDADKAVDKEEPSATTRTPSRFDKVKSIFAKHKATASTSKPAIPKPVFGGSKTPAPARAEKELPPAPMTTPGKSFSSRLEFTPAPKHAALAQNSPSPIKSGIPRSKASNSLVNYPSLDSVMENATAGHVSYPDLSGYRPLPSPPIKHKSPVEPAKDETPKNAMLKDETPEDPVESPVESPVPAPGNFTFRSDHTIRFDSASPNGFGARSGQASIRQVRPSIVPPPMPGAFPSSNMPATAAPDGKENVAPHDQEAFDVKSFPHGVANKKRLRVEDDEEEAAREEAMRAAKKMKAASVPEGEALVAPRLASAQKATRSPGKTMKKTPARSPIKPKAPPATTTPTTRKVKGISMSRLAYLATPKQRKC